MLSVLTFVLNQVLLSSPYITAQAYKEVVRRLHSESTTCGPDLFWVLCEGSSPILCLPLPMRHPFSHTLSSSTVGRASAPRHVWSLKGTLFVRYFCLQLCKQKETQILFHLELFDMNNYTSQRNVFPHKCKIVPLTASAE